MLSVLFSGNHKSHVSADNRTKKLPPPLPFAGEQRFSPSFGMGVGVPQGVPKFSGIPQNLGQPLKHDLFQKHS
jgi:hypothetical protein